ncbi:PilZ domain-containing protein [Salinicola sp. DM10]|uniref:PilZ domain-containing protein n=1 Tax=Salinicola sp. DM10 TaxID=2815721 RepID=UPI0004E787C1|nr:PilZ domain-containing protein [Salinicola sp. DM10]KFF50179.1 pilus assembly protein PilZ [Gammaproteobacteria bacterium MFB021]MCE3025477.1 PilZ domain-containing protein [Salinicola sp. DM10]
MSSHKALSLTIRDDDTLHSAYLAWLARGGLFVPTERHYSLGQRVYLLITLPDAHDRLPVEGEVVWLTPPGTADRVAGIGVHFGADGQALRERIEARLEAHPSPSALTRHTL